jgi:cytochrome c oxidase assembly protein subunit 15
LVFPDALPGSEAAGGSARAVRVWLLSVAALVFAMIVVGGATRLTDSGLSITEWQPLLGAIPPLTAADWQDAFSKYQQIPEYHLVNKGMSLAEFQFIYWWEWSHRFLGRLIGVAFALPFLFFWLNGRLSPGLAPRLMAVLLLGAVQGVVGWYMVQSGLADRIDVSQYRLALHLTIAMVIFGALLWLALDAGAEAGSGRHTASTGAKAAAVGLVALILLQTALGGLVAGLKAGLTYNTWPLMDGRLVPSGLGLLEPWYLNLFENVTTVQFDHRVMAYVILAAAAANAIAMARSEDAGASRLAWALAIAVIAQAALGIATLLAMVPLWLGLAHQAGAAIVFGMSVWYAYRVLRGPPRSARST